MTNKIRLYFLLPAAGAFLMGFPARSQSRPDVLTGEVSSFETGGAVGHRLRANEEQWLRPLLDHNPGMFGAFLEPDSNTLFKCMWHGEFPGKILTGLGQTYLTSRDPETLAVGNRIVGLLGRSQWDDGYLGPWPAGERFENPPEKWDTWGHYHCIYALLQWHRITGSEVALDIACRAADCVYSYFIGGGVKFAAQRWGECNFAISHAFALLYEETGVPRYLEAARYIVDKEWKEPYHDFYTNKELCCDWFDSALEGTAFCRSAQKRWESLYTLMTLPALYRITGERRYYDATDSLWWGMLRYDRHNTGSFGTGEGADGDVYGSGSETCNTVAWMAFSTEYLKLSKRSCVADELELSYYNAAMGSQVTGKEFVYMNFSDGRRISSQIELEPHSYAGAREMNCCQANGNRGLSQFTQWGVLNDRDGVYLNFYGPCRITTRTPGGDTLRLVQQTDYPLSGSVRVNIEPGRPERFSLYVRIPAWSVRTRVKVNGKSVRDPEPGTYCVLERKWRSGDVVELDMDMGVHYWVGAEKMQGKTSVYYGPVLLSMEKRPEEAALLCLKAEDLRKLKPRAEPEPGRWFCFDLAAADGTPVVLTDYATKRASVEYTTWLRVDTGLAPLSWDPERGPVWNNR